MFPSKDELLQSGSIMQIPQVSDATAAYYAEQCPATIVKFVDAQRKGKPIRAAGELDIDLNNLYLKNVPTCIPDPDANIPRRASEAYFAVWANTQYGGAAVNSIYTQLPGLRYKTTFSDGEIQSFVRELLTKNTNLNNNTSAAGTMTIWTKDMLAIAFLASVDRRLTVSSALKQVKDIFWSGRELPPNVAQEIRDILKEADNVFESDFGVACYLPDGTPGFLLPFGYENKILAHQYCLEKFAYFKMPNYEPKRRECSPLMGELPPELMVMVARKLLVFKDPIQVIRKPSRLSRKTEFYFKVCEPSHMRNATAFLSNTRVHPGWIISNLETFFALSKTNRKNYYLVREAFFKYNKIMLHRFDTISGYCFDSHDIKPWLEAIGREARRSLKSCLWSCS